MEIISDETGADIAILRPVGKLNMLGAGALRDAVAGAVRGGRHRVVVDLARVDFLDSSGLGALIAGLKSCRQAGGDLRIAAPNEQVQLVLQLTNMERILTAHPVADAAYDG
jgi:anti-sigma B factor antagonist